MRTARALFLVLVLSRVVPGQIGPIVGERRGAPLATGHPTVVGSVAPAPSGPLVEVLWLRDVGGEVPSRSRQTFRVPLRPTEVCGLGPDRLCVGGTTFQGETAVVLLELDSSAPLPEAVGDPETGRDTWPETRLEVAPTTELWRGDAPGRTGVRTMFHNHGRPDEVLVQFEDGRDVYSLDVETRTLTLEVPASLEPALRLDHGDRFSTDHARHGYLYLFLAGEADTLVLVDADRDGELDPAATLRLDAQGWSEAFPDGTEFREVF